MAPDRHPTGTGRAPDRQGTGTGRARDGTVRPISLRATRRREARDGTGQAPDGQRTGTGQAPDGHRTGKGRAPDGQGTSTGWAREGHRPLTFWRKALADFSLRSERSVATLSSEITGASRLQRSKARSSSMREWRSDTKLRAHGASGAHRNEAQGSSEQAGRAAKRSPELIGASGAQRDEAQSSSERAGRSEPKRRAHQSERAAAKRSSELIGASGAQRDEAQSSSERPGRSEGKLKAHRCERRAADFSHRSERGAQRDEVQSAPEPARNRHWHGTGQGTGTDPGKEPSGNRFA